MEKLTYYCQAFAGSDAVVYAVRVDAINPREALLAAQVKYALTGLTWFIQDWTVREATQ